MEESVAGEELSHLSTCNGVVNGKENVLETAKDHVLKENNDFGMKNMFEKIVRDIHDIKDVLLERRGAERDLMYDFGAVARHVDNMFDGVTNHPKTELQNIEQYITFIKEILIPQSELSPVIATSSVETSGSSRHSTFEVGEASNTAHLYSAKNYAQQSTAMTFSEETISMLDPQLRHCMFCLAVFPENSVVKKRLLIYWWISLGLVESTHGRTAEENGEIILMELINTGLVIPIYREHNRVVDRCRLQSQIRELTISAAEENQFLSMNPEGHAGSTFRGNQEDGTLLVFSTTIAQNEVWTLFNIDRKYLKFEESSYPRLRNMAVMQIGRWRCLERHHIEVENKLRHHIEAENTEFFKGLGTELKYLSLQGISRITQLPDSIGNLTNLIILDLRACHNLEELPVKLTLLKKLTHLDVSKCYLLDHMPKGLSSLTNLQVLKGFVIGNTRSKDPCRLGDLSRLMKLRKLSINIGRESMITEGDFDKLKEFTALRSLTITWGVHDTEHDSLTLQLSTPEKLEKLDIRCFPRAEPPTWLNPMALGSLKRLYIRGGKLSHLGDNIWDVKVLRLKFLKDFSIEWSQLLRIFPRRLRLEYSNCPKLTSFPRTDDGIWVT
ncbi:disease resistance RPP13-like protein 4 isoform X2 [Ananas comosus]|uniref:Disease resistance RPP13-like protein 4 isoform X2 n=1 Tax=Ananas comosus TaxID=4615 RepID=A0A6P5FWE5_ANACO|nr:disease resistance RPP13-like protein 4 isoform X2 [Ananas comosus]XP_020099987.1 disease resistance RPP13-like protein 4 isoform X2 [Ananas comosus]